MRLGRVDQCPVGKRKKGEYTVSPCKISNLKVDQGLGGLEVTWIPSTKTGIISFLRPKDEKTVRIVASLVGLSTVLLEFGLVGRTVDAVGGTRELS